MRNPIQLKVRVISCSALRFCWISSKVINTEREIKQIIENVGRYVFSSGSSWIFGERAKIEKFVIIYAVEAENELNFNFVVWGSAASPKSLHINNWNKTKKIIIFTHKSKNSLKWPPLVFSVPKVRTDKNVKNNLKVNNFLRNVIYQLSSFWADWFCLKLIFELYRMSHSKCIVGILNRMHYYLSF